MKEKPLLAITMGDPAGIGPELVAKVLSTPETWELCRPLVVADPEVMAAGARVARATLRFREVSTVHEARFSPPLADLLRPAGLVVGGIPWGRVDAWMGEAAARCLAEAYKLAMAGKVQGVVSAPLNKEAFHRAGYDYLDELAYLAEFTHSPDTFIAGAMGRLWVVTVTEHISFREVPRLIREGRVLLYIRRLSRLLRSVVPAEPRIAVAALNPHAGEGGLFGSEEIEEIVPAIREAQAEGIRVQGPVPADMVFPLALRGDFDGVVCMYHDQANIARKLQPMEERATLFMGLPVVCGTTAHGTAFDIAGRGVADPGSLAAALWCTVRLSGAEMAALRMPR